MEIILDGKKIQFQTCPGGPLQSMTVEAIYYAEGRLEEVAFANQQRSPELLATFNKAWLEAARVVTQLQYEIGHAKADLAALRGEIILTRAPAALMKMGLATEKHPTGSESIRQAFVDQQTDYRALDGIVTELIYIRDLFEAKRDALENAYESVKKILGSTAPGLMARNPNLSETVGGSPLKNPPPESAPKDEFDGFFGKAQF